MIVPQGLNSAPSRRTADKPGQTDIEGVCEMTTEERLSDIPDTERAERWRQLCEICNTLFRRDGTTDYDHAWDLLGQVMAQSPATRLEL